MLNLKDKLAAQKHDTVKEYQQLQLPVAATSPKKSSLVLVEDDEGESTPQISLAVRQVAMAVPKGITKIITGCSIRLSKNYNSFETHQTVEMDVDPDRDLREQQRESFLFCLTGIADDIKEVMGINNALPE